MMDLTDGLSEYKKDTDYWNFTLELEDQSKEVVRLLSKEPTPESLRKTKDFLERVELWKAMCMQEQAGNAKRNEELHIFQSLKSAIDANNDKEALLSVMSLVGFGSSVDESGIRRAKRATAVLRFLNPDEWGVVDWRTIKIVALMNKFDDDIDVVLSKARESSASTLREYLDKVDEDWACKTNQEYRRRRSRSLPRTADVEMAIFGISLKAWPMKK